MRTFESERVNNGYVLNNERSVYIPYTAVVVSANLLAPVWQADK